MKAFVILGISLAATAALAGDRSAKAWDTDHNGTLSAAEHAAGARAMFEKMDANRDGNVTADEMDAAQKSMRVAKHGATSDEHGDQHHGMSSADKIKVVDSNGDGILSAQEHAAGSRDMFTKMDTDRDGALSEAEFKAGHEKMLGEKHEDHKKKQM